MCARIFIAELFLVAYKWKNWMFMEGLGEIMKEWIDKLGFPDSSVGKESSCNGGDRGAIPGSGRSPGEGIGYPLQYSGLENSMDCIVYGVTKSRTRATLTFIFTFTFIHTKNFDQTAGTVKMNKWSLLESRWIISNCETLSCKSIHSMMLLIYRNNIGYTYVVKELHSGPS